MGTLRGKATVVLVAEVLVVSLYSAHVSAVGDDTITCPSGKYRFLASKALLSDGSGGGGRQIHLKGDRVEIPGVCQPTTGIVRSEAGVLNVSAKWERCSAAAGSVSLTGIIAGPYCTSIQGNVETTAGRSAFAAVLEKCDDTEAQTRPLVRDAVAKAMPSVNDPWGNAADFATVMLRTQAELGCALFGE